MRKYKRISHEKETKLIRCYRNFNESEFARDVGNIDWSAVHQATNIEDAVAIFNQELLAVIDKHLPWKRIRIRKFSAPWVSNEYLSFVDRREYCSRQYRKCPCEHHLALKKMARRECNRLRDQLKRDYLRKTLERFHNNPKKIWNTIQEFWPGSKNKASKINRIGNNCSSESISESMNVHFSNVANKIIDNLPEDVDINAHLPEQLPPVFEFKEISVDDILDAINRLSSSQAAGHDGMTSFMLKCAKVELLSILHYLFNMSITFKCVPTAWKEAIVTPLHKGGDRTDADNYRPISVLSTVSKLLERCIHDQLYGYLTGRNLLSEQQSGFQKGHSITTCLVDFLDKIYREVNEGGACGVLFLDLSKAFDTVAHDVLLLKLRHLGMKLSVVNWFASYLDNRSQCCRVDGHLSSPQRMNSGVPQASILGPLLFICYINDLPSTLRKSAAFLYADDTALLVKGKSVNDINVDLNAEMRAVEKWFNANKLAVNSLKTKSMLFSHSRFKDKHVPLHITPHNPELPAIEQVCTYKYLGVHLDQHLSFNVHLDKLGKKIKSRTFILNRMRNFISQNLACDLYRGLIEPHFMYADIIYDGASKQSRQLLQTKQNNALRVVANVDRHFSATKVHQDTNVPWLDIMRKERCCTEVYKTLNGISPPNVCNMFIRSSHDRALRSNSNVQYLPPRNKMVLADKNFVNRAYHYWQEIPVDIRNSVSLPVFKKNVKSGNFFKHET